MSNVSWGAITISIIVMFAVFGERCGGGCNGCAMTRQAPQTYYRTQAVPPQQAPAQQTAPNQALTQAAAQQATPEVTNTRPEGMPDPAIAAAAQHDTNLENQEQWQAYMRVSISRSGTPGSEDFKVSDLNHVTRHVSEITRKGDPVRVCAFFDGDPMRPVKIAGGLPTVVKLDQGVGYIGRNHSVLCTGVSGQLVVNNLEHEHNIQLIWVYRSGIDPVTTQPRWKRAAKRRCVNTRGRRSRKAHQLYYWSRCATHT